MPCLHLNIYSQTPISLKTKLIFLRAFEFLSYLIPRKIQWKRWDSNQKFPAIQFWLLERTSYSSEGIVSLVISSIKWSQLRKLCVHGRDGRRKHTCLPCGCWPPKVTPKVWRPWRQLLNAHSYGVAWPVVPDLSDYRLSLHSSTTLCYLSSEQQGPWFLGPLAACMFALIAIICACIFLIQDLYSSSPFICFKSGSFYIQHELGTPGPQLICALLLVFSNYWCKWELNSRDKELHLRELFGVMLKDTYAWYHWCQDLTTEVTSAFSINKTGYKCIIDHLSSN